MIYQPGPGEYSSPKKFGDDAKGFSIRGRPRDIQGNDRPGPGSYSPDHSIVKDKTISYRMDPNSKRAEIVSKD